MKNNEKRRFKRIRDFPRRRSRSLSRRIIELRAKYHQARSGGAFRSRSSAGKADDLSEQDVSSLVAFSYSFFLEKCYECMTGSRFELS
jgi:hypothetical protein